MADKILVVDDDDKLRSLLREYLEGYGYEVLTLTDGSRAVATINEHNPCLVVLDVMMPITDGFEVLSQIRKESAIPVIMLTAKGDDADKIVGLELGADDYIPKPFNPRELLARMKAILRRTGAADSVSIMQDAGRYIEAGGLRLDRSKRTMLAGDDEMELSATEYKLLEALLGKPDTVFSRDQLMNIARGRDFVAFDRSIDVHISNLRAKLKPYPGLRKRIKTVWGTGYMFVSAK